MGFVTLAHKVAEATKPVAGLLLEDIAEGSLVKLDENGSPVEFYVAKHDYEPSLNGNGRTLLVRKDCYDKQKWHSSSNKNEFDTCTISVWLNGTYKALLDTDVQTAIGETTFYYTTGDAKLVTLSKSVFLLSVTELGLTHSTANVEGSALPIATQLQVAYLDGDATIQWTRTPRNNTDSEYAFSITKTSTADPKMTTNPYGSRPCFTLPSNSVFNEETLLLEEVS